MKAMSKELMLRLVELEEHRRKAQHVRSAVYNILSRHYTKRGIR